MREFRLLERISVREGDSRRPGASEQELALESVVAHLKRLFNTRQGSVAMDPEYGMHDYSSMATRFSTANVVTLADIEGGFRTAIGKYEPRLRLPKVKILEKGEYEVTLFLEIEAQIKTSQEWAPVFIKVRMTPEGRIEVEA